LLEALIAAGSAALRVSGEITGRFSRLGQMVRIGDRWFVRYWERRNVVGKVERKRVSHVLGPVTTTAKRPPADVITEADRYMATTVNGVTNGR
jgi:hypothetical protein